MSGMTADVKKRSVWDGPKIRVLCVDDHAIVREGVSLIIEQQPDMEVAGVAESVEEAIAAFERLAPDVTLMDLRLGQGSGVDAIRAIKALNRLARVIVLTMYRGDEDVYRALEAGATTYLLKSTRSGDLARVVREVHAGQHVVAADVQAALAERRAGSTLTRREVQVLELLSTGMRNKEVGAALGISCETAHVHVRNILHKLNVQDRCAAVAVAVRRGILHWS